MKLPTAKRNFLSRRFCKVTVEVSVDDHLDSRSQADCPIVHVQCESQTSDLLIDSITCKLLGVIRIWHSHSSSTRTLCSQSHMYRSRPVCRSLSHPCCHRISTFNFPPASARLRPTMGHNSCNLVLDVPCFAGSKPSVVRNLPQYTERSHRGPIMT
jgi:hypothetical protein